MVRKRIGATLGAAMAGSLEEEEARMAAERARADTPPRSMSNPAVDRAKESVRSEDRQATRLIPTNQVRMSRISDRIDPEAGLESLIESIRSDGQKVPILVRRLPEGDYEVVYGRRRLLACRAVGCEVRASVMELDDEQALIAQGIENHERLNTSFIERALFAHRIEQAGFAPGVIQKVMGVDESLVRKMRAIASGIPEALITRIGPAPEAGRRQWEELKRICQDLGETRAAALADQVDPSLPSTTRLTRIIASVVPPTPAPPSGKSEPVQGRLAVKRSGPNLTFRVITKGDREFLAYLEERAPDLYREWKER